MAFIGPEARVGWRFAEHFEATLGLRGLVLIAPQVPLGRPGRRSPPGPATGRAVTARESLTGQSGRDAPADARHPPYDVQ